MAGRRGPGRRGRRPAVRAGRRFGRLDAEGQGRQVNPPPKRRRNSGPLARRWASLGTLAADRPRRLPAAAGGVGRAHSAPRARRRRSRSQSWWTRARSPRARQSNVVPAVRQKFEVRAGGTFKATGENVLETAAIGKVTFSSGNTYLAVPIMAGTQVSHRRWRGLRHHGQRDRPQGHARWSDPRAGTADVGVVAVVKGTGGNVAAATHRQGADRSGHGPRARESGRPTRKRPAAARAASASSSSRPTSTRPRRTWVAASGRPSWRV